MPPLIAARHRLRTRITSTSLSTTTAGVWAWPRAKPSTPSWRIGSPKPRSSPWPRSPSRATPTVRPIRSQLPTPTNSQVGIHTGRSRVASGTTFLKKLPRLLPKPSSTSTRTNEGALMSETATENAPLTVVLVHGAFADASSWNGVIERLQAAGIRVTAPAIPLRGIAHDSAYIASFLNQIPGPALAVGHSYGGAVISNAGNAANVVGLVFVAAYAPEDGERLGDVGNTSKDSILGPTLVPLKYPDASGSGVEFVVDPAKFRQAFAADLPPEQSAVMAATQRPAAEGAFSEPNGPPAWKSTPSWAAVATADKAAGADLVRSMAQRAGAEIVEVDASHVVMVSQPQAVTELILKALHAVS